jgi:hypothetical protein
VKEEAELEWLKFREERTAGILEINQLRQRVAAEEARKKAERGAEAKDSEDADKEMPVDDHPKPSDESTSKERPSDNRDVEMDAVDGSEPKDIKESKEAAESERKDEPVAAAPATENDDDALEY